MHGFRIGYGEGANINIYDVSGNNILIIGYTIISLHSGNIRKPLEVAIARSMGRDGEVIMYLRTLIRMGVIPD